VNPAVAARRALGLGWQAGSDEAGGRRPAGTRQHDGCNIGRYSLSRISSFDSCPTTPIRSKITLRNGARIIGKTWLADD
jgi:hypothetical protein